MEGNQRFQAFCYIEIQWFKDTYSPENKQYDLNVKHAVRLEHETAEPVEEINCERISDTVKNLIKFCVSSAFGG